MNSGFAIIWDKGIIELSIAFSIAHYLSRLYRLEVAEPWGECEFILNIKPVLERKLVIKRAHIDYHKCNGCYKCVEACPRNALISLPSFKPTIIEDLCDGCGKCVEVCNVNAIHLVAKLCGRIIKGIWRGIHITYSKPEHLLDLLARKMLGVKVLELMREVKENVIVIYPLIRGELLSRILSMYQNRVLFVRNVFSKVEEVPFKASITIASEDIKADLCVKKEQAKLLCKGHYEEFIETMQMALNGLRIEKLISPT